MLTYQNGRFYLGDASFALPDNCKVDGYSEFPSHNGLLLHAPDGSYRMDISFEAYDGDARAFLQNMADDQECGASPEPFIFGGLHGWELDQNHSDATRRSLAFDVNGGYDPDEEGKPNILEIIVWSEDNVPWDKIRIDKTFCELLAGIQG